MSMSRQPSVYFFLQCSRLKKELFQRLECALYLSMTSRSDVPECLVCLQNALCTYTYRTASLGVAYVTGATVTTDNFVVIVTGPFGRDNCIGVL